MICVDHKVPDPDELLQLGKEDVVKVMFPFILEVRNANGAEYNRDTLYNLIMMVSPRRMAFPISSLRMMLSAICIRPLHKTLDCYLIALGSGKALQFKWQLSGDGAISEQCVFSGSLQYGTPHT